MMKENKNLLFNTDSSLIALILINSDLILVRVLYTFSQLLNESNVVSVTESPNQRISNQTSVINDCRYSETLLSTKSNETTSAIFQSIKSTVDNFFKLKTDAIVIPKYTGKINGDAFYHHENLKEVIFNKGREKNRTYIFASGHTLIKNYLPRKNVANKTPSRVFENLINSNNVLTLNLKKIFPQLVYRKVLKNLVNL